MSWVLNASGAAPVFDANYATDQYWFNGAEYGSHAAFLTAIGGTFARADASTCATYFDSSGVQQLAAANVLRFDHDPETGTPRGVRLAGSRTNLQVRSNDPGQWGISNLAGTANGAEGLDGTMSAFLIPTGGTPAFGQYNHTIAADTATHVATLFVKPITAGLGTFNSGTIGINGVDISTPIYDFATRAFRSGGTGWTVSAGPNGFTTFRRVFTNNGAGVTFIFRVDRDADNLYQMAFGGGLLEKAAFASFYIPTTTAAVTRAADSYTATQAGTAQGSIIIHGRTPLGASGDQVLWQWDDGTENNRLRLVRDSSTGMHFIITVSGVDVADISDLGNVANDTYFRVGAAWAAGDFRAYLDGSAGTADVAGAIPTVTTERWGSDSAGNQWYGTLPRAARFSTAISNADLADLTNWKQTDTHNKRSSAIMISLPWRGQLPAPDGTINQPDRQQTGLLYAGTLAAGSGRASDRGLLRPPGRMIH